MLILTLNEYDNYVQIGDDIRIYVAPLPGEDFYKRIRVKIDAPREMKISRRKVLEAQKRQE